MMAAWPAVWSAQLHRESTDHARGPVTIVIVDDGVDITRSELRDRLAVNVNEIPNNGVDDDVNGFVDDVMGYDFIEQDPMPMPVPGRDDPSHGTKMAIVALRATGDIRPGTRDATDDVVSVLPLRVATGGVVNTAAVISAIRYAGSRRGRLVVNLSIGTLRSSVPDALLAALAAQPDTLFVISAGNQGKNVDELHSSMCKDHPANVVCVAAIDNDDELSRPPRASNFGYSVDVAAFGVDVAIADSTGEARLDTGTSLAAADVSGVAAGIWVDAPDLRPSEIARILCEGARSSERLEGSVRCGIVDGTLSLASAVSSSEGGSRLNPRALSDDLRISQSM